MRTMGSLIRLSPNAPSQTHHKEIGLAVDTAKLILAAFPATARLVVGGIGPEFQPAMAEMLDAVSRAAADGAGGRCLVLFPTEDARTFDEIKGDVAGSANESRGDGTSDAEAGTAASANAVESDAAKGWDVVVVDGTWSQARKMHAKYFPQRSAGSLYRVQLSEEAVRALDRGADGRPDESSRSENTVTKGHQLRRHPIKVRSSTLISPSLCCGRTKGRTHIASLCFRTKLVDL